MRSRVGNELRAVRAASGSERVVWIRAAASAEGPVVADAITDQGQRIRALEGHALGPAIGRPRPRWIAGLVRGGEVLVEAPAVLRALGGGAELHARVVASGRRVFGVVVLVGTRRRRAGDRPLVELERAAERIQAWVEATEERAPAHLVVDDRGQVLFGCAQTAAWRAEVEDAVLEPGLHCGVRVEARSMEGPSGRAWLLAVGSPPPLARAADASLSDTQRKVADYAAAGATVPEIARSLSSSGETVRTHLREVYRRLGVSCRVELVRALGDGSARVGSADPELDPAGARREGVWSSRAGVWSAGWAPQM